jgi:hypothetical protein
MLDLPVEMIPFPSFLFSIEPTDVSKDSKTYDWSIYKASDSHNKI